MHYARIKSQLVGVILLLDSGKCCDPQVVSSAASDGFIAYVLTECLDIENNGLNWRGEDSLGKSACLANWILEHSESESPIPASGDCRNAFQSLIDSATHNWLTVPHNILDEGRCSYDVSTNTLDITYWCWLAMEVELREFRRASGAYILEQRCDARTVRQMTAKDAYEYLVKDAFSLVPLGVTELVPESTTTCYGCYESFSEQLSSFTSGKDDVITSCLEDPYSDSCRMSTMMQEATAEFKECSGGYSIDFVGPICSQTEVDKVLGIVPQPFHALAHCGFTESEFCATLDTYYSKIQSESSSQCVDCYIEFAAHIRALGSSSVIVTEACTGHSLGVFYPECIARLADAFIQFGSCAGARLDILTNNVLAPTLP